MAGRLLPLAAAILGLCTQGAVAQDLQESILAGDRMAAARIIAASGDLAAQTGLGTPLHVAALMNDTIVARLLLDRGAPIEARSTGYEMTPLHTAASYNKPQMTALLIDRGASLEARELSGRTPSPLRFSSARPNWSSCSSPAAQHPILRRASAARL